MAILETAITFQGVTLVEKQYYATDNILDRNVRNSMLQAISGLAAEAFNDSIQSFSIGEYSIILISRDIEEPINPENIEHLQMYCIIEKNTDEKAIKKSMNEALTQFLNRHSLNNIWDKNVKKFQKFPKRLENIFKDLILKSEDRFKSLF